MNKKSKLKSMGIYSTESKECGCELRRYAGGKVITTGCKVHSNVIEYVCPACGKKLKNLHLLKECKWSHAK